MAEYLGPLRTVHGAISSSPLPLWQSPLPPFCVAKGLLSLTTKAAASAVVYCLTWHMDIALFHRAYPTWGPHKDSSVLRCHMSCLLPQSWTSYVARYAAMPSVSIFCMWISPNLLWSKLLLISNYYPIIPGELIIPACKSQDFTFHYLTMWLGCYM